MPDNKDEVLLETEVSKEEEQLAKLKSSKSPGPDGPPKSSEDTQV